LLALLALSSSVGEGCASHEAARRDEARAAREAARAARHTDVRPASYAEDDASAQMTVEGEEGTLNAADVEAALHEHFAEIRDCFHLDRRVRESGRLMLRFFVDARGEVQDVQVVESSLGSKVIERCVADIGLGVMFERPAGHKATTFDYPVEFRSGRELTADRRKP
jgi:TonB family protein